jgi:hypothetical protein
MRARPVVERIAAPDQARQAEALKLLLKKVAAARRSQRERRPPMR